MPRFNRILAQNIASATVNSLIYSCPTGRVAEVQSILINNQSGVIGKCNISLGIGGATALWNVASNTIVSNAASTTLTPNLVMNSGDMLFARGAFEVSVSAIEYFKEKDFGI